MVGEVDLFAKHVLVFSGPLLAAISANRRGAEMVKQAGGAYMRRMSTYQSSFWRTYQSNDNTTVDQPLTYSTMDPCAIISVTCNFL